MMKAALDLEGKVLGCWCAPKLCHGEEIIEVLEEEAARRHATADEAKTARPNRGCQSTDCGGPAEMWCRMCRCYLCESCGWTHREEHGDDEPDLGKSGAPRL